MLLGIDVSSHNPPSSVPWAGHAFGFVRVTMGRAGLDSHAYEHLMRARQHGVALGVYHYERGDAPGDEQARHFAARVADLEQTFGPLALSVDAEDLPPPALPWHRPAYAAIIDAFVSVLAELLPRPCMPYGSPGYLAALKLSPRVLAQPFWLAHWNVPKDDAVRLPQDIPEPAHFPPLPPWTVHQYAVTDGIDRNRFRGDAEDFRRVFGLSDGRPSYDILGNVLAGVRAAEGRTSAEHFVTTDEGPVIPRGE